MVAKRTILTDRSIVGRLLPAGKKTTIITDSIGKRGTGRLMLKVTTGAKGELKEFYFRYYFDGQDKRFKIGTYPEMSLAAARERYSECSEIYQAGSDPAVVIREQIRTEQAARKAQASFEDVLDKYLDSLQQRDKASFKTVRGNFNCYVKKPHRELLEIPANQITGANITAILRTMRSKGIETTCNRVRGQLSAAFNHCMKADDDWRTEASSNTRFNLEQNPVEKYTSPDVSFERERDQAMTRQELKGYLVALETVSSPVIKAFLQLQMMLGGQRPKQLLQLKWGDIDRDSGTLTIINTKDNNKAHVLPLLPCMVEVLQGLAAWLRDAGYTGEYLFPGRRGKDFHENKPMAVATVSREFRVQADRLGMHDIQLKDNRRTFKTIGASIMNVETLDRIQAHAVGSRISNRYNRYEYLEVKRHGLTIWNDFITKLLSGEDQPAVNSNILQFAV